MNSILDDYIALWRSSSFASQTAPAWEIVSELPKIVGSLVVALDPSYAYDGDVAVHRTAKVDANAVLKGPLIVGPNCMIAAGALIRGGCWIDSGCVVGPGSELKTSILF